MRMRIRLTAFTLMFLVVHCLASDLPIVKPFSELDKDLVTLIDPSGPSAGVSSPASLTSVAQTRTLLMRTIASDRSSLGVVNVDDKNFSCIVHVVKWNVQLKDDQYAWTPIRSNWYAYNAKEWHDADLISTKRLYGVNRPYVLIVFLTTGEAVDVPSSVNLRYTYEVKHHLPANIQNLQNAFSLFQQLVQKAQGEKVPPPITNAWAVGQLDGDPPSDITITSAAAINQKAKADSVSPVNIDSQQVKFDNEGFYRWDISIGVPILSYKQLETLSGPSGVANFPVDKRNLLLLGNFYLKPVDVKRNTFLGIPHIVGGASIASQPLHSAFAGLGWGPAIANFYFGTMIVTNNLPNKKTATHLKFGFGLNMPIRAISNRLGLKTP